MFVHSERDTIIPIGVILNTKAVVPTGIRAAATPLAYILGEGFWRIGRHVPAGRPIPPLSVPY